MTAPISSPLKVRERKGRIWAENEGGQIVVDGRTREHWPERYVAQTASGTHRVGAKVEGGPLPHLPIIDSTGREMARILTPRRQDWTLQLASGESAAVTGRGGMLSGITCTIGDWSKAAAPRLAPQRYFTLTLADSVLSRPDHDLVLVALVWLSETTIASRISDPDPGG